MDLEQCLKKLEEILEFWTRDKYTRLTFATVRVGEGEVATLVREGERWCATGVMKKMLGDEKEIRNLRNWVKHTKGRELEDINDFSGWEETHQVLREYYNALRNTSVEKLGLDSPDNTTRLRRGGDQGGTNDIHESKTGSRDTRTIT